MATISVDNKEIKVKDGALLIEELLANGIEIPHFCYHPALGKDGNCRMCMVEIEGKKRPQIACDTPIVDGMIIRTKGDMIQRVKRQILEMELINHPIDCPVCDQAGECSLQNYYMDVGLYESRLSTPKTRGRKHVDIGANVVLDQERCVLCTRCVRFTKEITKTKELGVLNRTDHSVITTFPGRPLSNPYAMNVVDLCPVGALTSKDFRFHKRVWLLEPDEAICNGCSKGCSLYVDHHKAKYENDSIFRYRPRFNDKVNGYFICDVGRLSYKQENENREAYAQIRGQKSEYEYASGKLLRLLKRHHSKTVFLVSPSLSLEEMIQVKRLAKKYDAKLSGYDVREYDEHFGDDYLKCNDLSTNRRGFNLLNIDEKKENLEEFINDAELVVFIGRDDIETLPKLKEVEVKVVINSKMPEDGTAYDLYLPMLTHMSREGTFINIDGFLQFSKAKVETALETESLAKIVSNILEDNTFTCKEIWQKELSKIIKDIKFEDIQKDSQKNEYVMSGTLIGIVVFNIVIALVISLVFVPILVWMERRVAGFMQDRMGPNRCHIGGVRLGGIVQSFADMLKLVFKEDYRPHSVKEKMLFTFSPVIVFATAYLSFMVMPFADDLTVGGKTYMMQALPIDFGLLWILAFTGLGVYGLMLGGWASNNKYSLLGGIRAAAQVISYEAVMGLSLISMLIVYGSINLGDMVRFQGQLIWGFIPAWGIVIQPVAAILFIITAFAETNRAPFDIAEGESEIVGGFHTEYSAMRFGLFFVGEYIAMGAASAFIVTLFLGGFQIPWLNTASLKENIEFIFIAMIVIIPVGSYFFAGWMKKNNVWLKADDVRNRETKWLVNGLVIINIILVSLLIGFLMLGLGQDGINISVAFLQILTFIVKLLMMNFFFIWVRWTLVRFRYDQLQNLAWKVLLPIAIANIFFTGIFVVVMGV